MRPIIINGRFLLHRTTGVERYAREIIEELDKIILPGSITMAVPPEIENVPVYQNIKVIKTGKFKNRLWEHISFPWYVHRQSERTDSGFCSRTARTAFGRRIR